MQIDHINNRYKIVKQLGEGGMGSVLLSQDLANSNRLTAIKTIKPKFLENPESLAHFKHEYEIMSKLWHPNLALVYDFGELEDGGYYLAMEYINGQELNQVISREKKLQFREALPIITDLLRAMEFIHSRNIIYCDIKPQNILITDDNRVKLIDFGLSDFGNEVTKDVKGTMRYIAPEVINGKEKDNRADIFSLGVLFYEMLTDELFYQDSSISSIVSKLTSKQEYKSVVDIAFENLKDSRIRMIIEKMCAFDYKDRYSSCADVMLSINKALDLKTPIETEETKEAFVTGVPFTAREKELKHLEKFLESSENKLLTIIGKQGIGKSKLLSEFQMRCNIKGVIFLQGSSLNGESYEPFLEIITKLLFLRSDFISDEAKKNLYQLLPYHPILSEITIDENNLTDSKTLKDILVETISSLIVNYSRNIKNKVVIVFKNFSRADEISLEIVSEILYKIKIADIDNLKLLAECRVEEQQLLTDFILKLKEKDRIKVLKLEEFSETDVESYIKNTFGAKAIHSSISKKIAELHKYCGGNPFFLQELLKSMVSDGVIIREGSFWELTGSITSTKLSSDLQGIIKRRIDRLKLSDSYKKGLIFISFSRQEKISLEFYQKFVQKDLDINWQTLFDLLVKKEFLVLKDGYFVLQNQLFKDVLFEPLEQEEKTHFHQLWVNTLENKIGSIDYKIELLEDKLLKELSHHYTNLKITDALLFENKTAKFLFEIAKREKNKYANKTAIIYFRKLLEKIDELGKLSFNLQNVKALIFENLGVLNQIIGKWDKAQQNFERAYQLATQLDLVNTRVDSMNSLGDLLRVMGNIPESIQITEKALLLANTANYKVGIINALGNIGIIYKNKSEFAKAMDCYQRKLMICEELKDQSGISRTTGNMGVVFWKQGDLDKAMECFEKDLEISNKIGDKFGIGRATGNMGSVYFSNQNYQKAMECYQKYLTVCKEIGDKRGIGIAVGNIGTIYWNLDNLDKAMEFFEVKTTICEELGDKFGMGRAIGNIGSVYNSQNNLYKAMECYQKQLKIFRELGFKSDIAETYHQLGIIYKNIGDFTNAVECYQQKLNTCLELNDKKGCASALGSFTDLYIEMNDNVKALQFCEQAIEMDREISNDSDAEFFLTRHLELRDYLLNNPLGNTK